MSYRKRFAAALSTVAIICISSIASAQDDFAHWDYASNREYVPGYFRLAPYGKIYDKWSTFGNINPLHARLGTKILPLMPQYGDVIYVGDYSHLDGTYVPRHIGSAPHANNVSIYPNVNPYSRNFGTRIPPPSVVYVPTEPSVVYVPTEPSVADVPAEGRIYPPGRDLNRSAPPADRLKSRVQTYTRRPTYQIRLGPNSFARP